ncbi:uncharacterized protein LOC132204290 [Neocloeon triangulifer]|uniref:uncharacterized protein LOC132204290 n=1 Tax=Neocloeon triangulifer TaxID=2078957 RepID=UPI00286F1617|nr:uncharacterized protein LOC132204290 [Neocloeon triangulifer]XP_059488686.1 uncharacterized protein LOC132204290 [Neocloeon triangulifer]
MESEEEPLVSDEESGCCSDSGDSDEEGSATPAPSLTSARVPLIAWGAAVAASGSALVATLPLAAPSASSVPCPLFLAVAAAAVGLCGLALLAPRVGPRRGHLGPLVRAGGFQGAAVAALGLASQPGRLMCHLQVPLMGTGLAFALAFCFIICKKVVSLRRLLSGLIVILGVFVSVDLQLCNEFRCLGNQVPAAKKSAWAANGAHFFWAAVYVLAIAIWAFSCALLENFFLLTKAKPSALLVSTVETWTAAPDLLLPRAAPEEAAWRTSVDVAAVLAAAQVAALVVFAAISALATVLLKGVSPWDWLLELCWCLWQQATCAWTPWVLAATYAPFLFATCHFLRTTESALFAMAAASVALPVSGVWWSVVRMQDEKLIFDPTLSGDLVSAFFGLPIIGAGLVLFARLHMAELRRRLL